MHSTFHVVPEKKLMLLSFSNEPLQQPFLLYLVEWGRLQKQTNKQSKKIYRVQNQVMCYLYFTDFPCFQDIYIIIAIYTHPHSYILTFFFIIFKYIHIYSHVIFFKESYTFLLYPLLLVGNSWHPKWFFLLHILRFSVCAMKFNNFVKCLQPHINHYRTLQNHCTD